MVEELDSLLSGKLIEQWRTGRDRLSGFLKQVELGASEYSQALYIRPIQTPDMDRFTDTLAAQVANDGVWVCFTGKIGNEPSVIAFPVSWKRPTTNRRKLVLALYVEVHSRLVAWWLVNAWRSEQLASATWALGDTFKIIPAAACARSLLETAASFWVETTKFRDTWRDIKSDCAKNGPDIQHWFDLTKLISTMMWSAKFDENAPELAKVYGRMQRTNILTHIRKLARATSASVQEDYQWLCNTVHPSIGGMLAFEAPMMIHPTNTHAFQWVSSEPLRIQRGDLAERETTVAETLARSTAFSVEVLSRTLDDALKIVDDIGLTTGAPATARFKYWRQISQKGQNSPCPCRSGKLVKHCLHRWVDVPPDVVGQFCVDQ